MRQPTAGPLAVAYFGALAPDEPRFRSSAFSPAGHRWQKGLLDGLVGAGLAPSLVGAFPPFPAFPRGPLLVRGEGQARNLSTGPPLHLLGYANLPGLKVAATAIRAAVALRRWARAEAGKTRVALFYNLYLPPVGLLLRTASRAGVRVVATVNDVYVPGAQVPDTLARRLEFAWQRRAAGQLAGALVVADAIATDFLGSRPWIRVEGGVTAEEIAAGRQRTARRATPFTVGFAGSLEPYNGIRELVAAAPALGEHGVAVRIAGAGPLAGEVERAAAELDNLTFDGQLPLEEMSAFYGRCDLLVNWRIDRRRMRYVFPSKVLEYLASGVPTLSTSTGSIPAAFGGNLLSSESESVEALVERVVAARDLGPHRLRSLGDGAVQFMADHFTWAAQGQRIRRFLEGALVEVER